MKNVMRKIVLLLLASLAVLVLAGFSEPLEADGAKAWEAALARLEQGNADYVESEQNPAPLTYELRRETAQQGQRPYAVIVTCSDSRVPAEHIFSAGIGEIFVVRSAGNVLDEVGMGSVEYGVEHLGAPLVVVMGHTKCGAVAATIEGGGEGNIKSITDRIASNTGEEKNPSRCEVMNAEAVAVEIEKSPVLAHMGEAVRVMHAIYNIESGEAVFY